MSFNLSEILPHKPPMILIDDILDYDLQKETLTAVYRPLPDKLFFDKTINGVSSLVGLEIMAQTIGCYSYFKGGKQKPIPGLLLGARLYNNQPDYFECGKTYEINVKKVFMDENIGAFECKIFDPSKNEISSATINVYQCSDGLEFLNNE